MTLFKGNLPQKRERQRERERQKERMKERKKKKKEKKLKKERERIGCHMLYGNCRKHTG